MPEAFGLPVENGRETVTATDEMTTNQKTKDKKLEDHKARLRAIRQNSLSK